MNSFNLFSLILVIAGSKQINSDLPPPQNHLDYTSFLIQHLARQQVGTFECIFEDLELSLPFDGWFGQLLSSPALAQVVKYVINASFEATYFNLPHKPSLVVVNAGNRILRPPGHHCHIGRNFFYLDSNTRVLVLVNVTCLECVDSITRLLNAWQFDKVVYMGNTRRIIFLMDHEGTITTILKHFPPPEELFLSSARNLQRRGIRMTSKGPPPTPYVRWAQETAKYVNTVALYIPGICTRTMTIFQCIDQLMHAQEVDVALDMFAVNGLSPRLYRMMFSHEPVSQIILVPESRSFNDIEMFVKPFAWEGWIVLISMLLLIEVISWVFPNLFKNDPVLFLVCGFERYNLHDAKTREKVVFFPLVVFFFLMFNAYETKIISFMTNKPSVGRITTLEQLTKSGLKIKANLKSNIRILNDSLLGPYIVPMAPNESLFHMDGINAYDTDTDIAPDLISSLSNYDFKLNRPKYTVINERHKTTVGMFYIGLITPLAEIFRFTQRIFFEAGLFNVWARNVSYRHSLTDRAMFANVESDDLGLLMFDDLLCTWIALAVGLSIALVAFMVEFVFQFRGKL